LNEDKMAESLRLEIEVLELRRSLRTAEQARVQAEGRAAELELQSQEMMNLAVASQRLHSTLDRSDVLAGIQEIVINLIGSEEMGIFEVSPDGQALRLASSFGLDESNWQRVSLESGAIGERVQTGEAYVHLGATQKAPGEALAVVPLKFGEQLVGAVAVFGLLPQKGELRDSDRQLFELIGSHGGLALYSTALAGRGGEG
jgi:hypothetical protein